MTTKLAALTTPVVSSDRLSEHERMTVNLARADQWSSADVPLLVAIIDRLAPSVGER